MVEVRFSMSNHMFLVVFDCMLTHLHFVVFVVEYFQSVYSGLGLVSRGCSSVLV